MLPRLCFVAAWLALLLAAGAVRAQDAGLKGGAAALASGKYNEAVRQLSATINSDSATPGDAAKALYLRGIAYRKMGDSARAAADLGAAIWLGLPDADRVKALVNRGLAFQAAGLSKEGEAEIASARKIGGNHEVDQLVAEGGGSAESAASITAFSTDVHSEGQATASAQPRSSWWPKFGRSDSSTSTPAPAPAAAPALTAASNAPQGTNKPSPAPSSWSTSVATEQHESSSPSSSGGSRLTRWFGSLTDSSSSPPPAPAVETASATPPSSKPPSSSSPASSPPAASSSWSTTTANASNDTGGSESKSSWRIFGRGSDTEPAAQPAAAPSASGGYRLQLATSRSQEEANALWKKVSQSEGLEGVSPQIEKVDIGNFGTFYSLRIGPFPDKAQSVKVCNALKRSGIDCSPVTL
jgi:tetratricopeptide (TPR) repeat protein